MLYLLSIRFLWKLLSIRVSYGLFNVYDDNFHYTKLKQAFSIKNIQWIQLLLDILADPFAIEILNKFYLYSSGHYLIIINYFFY